MSKQWYIPVLYTILALGMIAWIVFLFNERSLYTSKHIENQHKSQDITTIHETRQSSWVVQWQSNQINQNNQSTMSSSIVLNQWSSSQGGLDAVAVKELFASLSRVDTSNDNIQVLLAVYERTQNQELLQPLLDELVAQYRFSQAYDIIQPYAWERYRDIDPHTVLYILWNSSLIRINDTSRAQELQELISYYGRAGVISPDDVLFYQSLFAFFQEDIETMLNLLDQIQDPLYNGFRQDVQEAVLAATYTDDLPAYYVQGLVSLEVMQYGYFILAQQVAIDILLDNDGYNLPYQILAYSHFVMNNRERAIEYFIILLEQWSREYWQEYTLFLGIAYYWHGEYDDALLYLGQLPVNHPFRLDILRYMIASYKQLDATNRLVQSYQRVLGQENIYWLDYYDYFETALFAPLIQQAEYSLVQSNEFVLQQYIQTCIERLPQEDQYICDYWRAGELLYRQNIQEAGRVLEQLIPYITKSYIYAALADYYDRIGDTVRAQEMYTNAINKAVDEDLRNRTQEKLLELIRIQ